MVARARPSASFISTGWEKNGLATTQRTSHRYWSLRVLFFISFGYASTTYRDQVTAQVLTPTQPTTLFWISTNLSAACRHRSRSLDITPRPQRSTQACLSLSKCFSLPFWPWLGRRPFRPALEAQAHRSHHLVRQDTLPLLCQWPGLRIEEPHLHLARHSPNWIALGTRTIFIRPFCLIQNHWTNQGIYFTHTLGEKRRPWSKGLIGVKPQTTKKKIFLHASSRS